MSRKWWDWKGRALVSYALAVVFPLLVLDLCQALRNMYGEQTSMILFMVPILLSAYWGGLGPGLLATFASAVLSAYYLLEPLHNLSIASVTSSIALIGIVAAGVLTSILMEWLHRERRPREAVQADQLLTPMKRKVDWGFGIALALLGIVGVTAYVQVIRLRDNDQMVDHTHQVISSLRKVQSLVADAETGQRGFLITGDRLFLRPYNEAREQLDGELGILRTLIADNPNQQGSRRELEASAAKRMQQLREVLELREKKGISAAGQEILTLQGMKTDNAIRQIVKGMEEREDQLLVEREHRALVTSLYGRSIVVLGSLLAFSFVGVALFLITQDIAGSRNAAKALRDAKEHLELRVQERTSDLEQSNQQLAQSREQYAVTLASIGDGVITTDATCRVSFMNAEAERLTGWMRQEAMGQPLTAIFRIMNEESREAMEDPAKKVLELGTVIGLANHTLLVNKEGYELPIADSGAPIRDAEGNILGVVLVFRDCRAEREKEIALEDRVALQAQLAKIAETAPGAICSFLQRPDGSCYFPYCNATILQIFPIPLEKLGRDASGIFQLIYPQDVGKVRATIEDSAKNLTTWSCEFRVKHPERGEIWVEGRSVPQRQADGSVLWHGILQDVTLRHLAEEQVRGGEARLSAIIHSAISGVITVDENQNIILFNPAAEQMFGCKEAEAIGHPMDQFIPARYRTAHQNHIRKFGAAEIAGRKMGQREGIFGLRRNGDEFPVEASISHVEFGGKKMFTVILRDVTEEKKAEEELKQQASLLDLAPVMVRDMEGRIVLWSRGAEKIYGFTKEEAVGRNSHELLQTEHPIPLWMIDRLLRTAGIWEGELRHRTRDGGLVYVASQWVLYRDAHGTPIRVLEVNSDITAWRHAEEVQTRSQKLEALGTLAGGIAHDFNNILLAINGNAQLAMADVPQENPARQSLAEILKAGARASELVKRILGFSRPQEQKKQVVQLQPVIEEALKLMRATLPARVRFKTEFAADLPPARVDPSQVHQVIVNLATNAAHAIGEKNGTIDIRLDAMDVHADDRQAAGKLEEGKYLRLFVSDDGCGMDRATMNRIFDPFFTTKKQGEGTGLGLSVVHGIVTTHGGAISVTSEPGEGTAFHLFFPIATEAVEALTEAPKESSQPRSEHILYVDDEEALVFLATRLLERRGYRVSGFTSAVTALNQFRESPLEFDAVVTDLSMPGMSGFDLTEGIHQIRADIPVILTSGYLQAEDQQRAEILGIQETIQKPATAEKLAGALEKILSEQAQRAHTARH
ncbi:MAG TPA: PAS domain S-box protein [Candidatus Acidoferrum sp.]|nr:PAS domain S-box protein [Candidatus Acidoferrum sp.]